MRAGERLLDGSRIIAIQDTGRRDHRIALMMQGSKYVTTKMDPYGRQYARRRFAEITEAAHNYDKRRGFHPTTEVCTKIH